MELTRNLLHERQIALIQHYLVRLKDMQQMHAQGRSAAQEALQHFDQEWQQLQAQQQQAARLAQRDNRAAALVSSFPDHAGKLLLQVDTRAAANWVDEALRWTTATDLTTRFDLLRVSYNIHTLRRDVPRLREILAELEALANRLDDDSRRLDVIELNINYWDDAEEYDTALAWAEQALMLTLRLEDDEQLATAYHNLGFACIRVDQYSRAEESLETALSLFRKLGMRLNEGDVLNALALNAYSWSRFDVATAYGEQSLAILREVGRRDRELTVLGNLAILAVSAGNLEKALHYGQQVLAAATETGLHSVEHSALGALLLTTAKLGLADELVLYTERSRVFLQASPSEEMEFALAWSLWLFAHEREDWQTACQYAIPAAQAARAADNDEQEHDLTAACGCSLAELGALDEAAAAFSRCLEMRGEQFESPLERSMGLAGLSYVEVRRGNREQAQNLLDEYLSLMADASPLNLVLPFTVMWNACRAALALNDPRVKFILAQFESLLGTCLNHFHDTRLRTSFLQQYSLRSLQAVISSR